MLKSTDLLSKTKCSNLQELLEEAKEMAVDNDWLQGSIERYLQTGSEFYLKAIINAVEYKHELEEALYKK
ncbi:MAG: hypothetical protein ACE5J3_08000 [Methanosarcinales archaeon]